MCSLVNSIIHSEGLHLLAMLIMASLDICSSSKKQSCFHYYFYTRTLHNQLGSAYWCCGFFTVCSVSLSLSQPFRYNYAALEHLCLLHCRAP